MSRELLLVQIYTIFFLSGCTAGLTDPEIDFKPPKYVEQMPAREGQKDYISQGSIFGQGDNPLFSDHKAMNVNDIVRVLISETASSSSIGKKSFSEADSTKIGAGTFAYGGGNARIKSATNVLNDLSNIGFNAGSNSSYDGSGTAVKDARFTTTISARVVKVLKNGNYFISGRREILVDKQKQIIQISGVIRPYDIDQNNKIDSAKMSDAKILYKSEGDVDRATEQGWGTKIIKAIWPF
jgi:flagellar L-ring protein precursor FlgH